MFVWDIASIYSKPNHELRKQWTGLFNRDKRNEVQGYVRVSITIIAPNEKPIVHDSENENSDDEDEEEEEDGMFDVLLPPFIEYSFKQLELKIFSTNWLPNLNYWEKDHNNAQYMMQIKFGNYTLTTPIKTHQDSKQIAQSNENVPNIEVESIVNVDEKGEGVVKFIGTTEFGDNIDQIWYGIAMNEPIGTHNGTVNGKTYFECDENCGLFVVKEKLSISEDFNIGDKVFLDEKGNGEVKFIGHTNFGQGMFYGLMMDEPVGTHNGTLNGEQYFECPAKHGIFARKGKLKKVELEDAKTAKEVEIDDLVLLPEYGTGNVKFVGTVEFLPIYKKNTIMYGVALHDSKGKHDGTVRGKKYFRCAPNCGVFVTLDKLQLLPPGSVIFESTVIVQNKGPGIVRYIGQTVLSDEVLYGIELKQPNGNHDGTVDDVKYFECKPGFGVLTNLNSIKLLGQGDTNQLDVVLDLDNDNVAEADTCGVVSESWQNHKLNWFLKVLLPLREPTFDKNIKITIFQIQTVESQNATYHSLVSFDSCCL